MNPQEIPEAYDLKSNEDTQRLFNGLELHEKNALQEKFAQEKQVIIYLTKSEIESLKISLGSENNHHSDRVERIASFLEEQRSEGASLSDMLEGNTEINPEVVAMLPEIEIQAQEFLFGNTGYMKQLNMSESSEDRVSLGFSLLILETLASGELDTATLTDPNNTSIFADIETQFAPLKELADIQLTSNGDKNTVLQDPFQAKEIFRMLMEEEVDTEQIKIYIEGGNLSPREDDSVSTLDISKISEFSQEQLLLLQEKITGVTPHETLEEATTPTSVPVSDTTIFQNMPPEDQQTVIERLKAGNFLERLFASILEAFQNLGIYREENSTATDTVESETTQNIDNPKSTLVDENTIDMKGVNIAVGENWVHEQIGETIADIQAPKLSEIQNILQTFQNADFSTQENSPENSARAIYALQIMLSFFGYGAHIGSIDGLFGEKTKSALVAFQKETGLSESGLPEKRVFEVLLQKIESLQE